MAATRFAFEQVKKALAQGQLTDMVSTDLVLEAFVAISLTYHRRLNLAHCWHLHEVKDKWLPLDLDAVERALQTYFGTEYYRSQWINAQIRQKAKSVDRILKTRGVSVRVDPGAMAEARARAEAEAQGGSRFPAPNVLGEDDLHLLPGLLADIKELGIREIREAVLPSPDRAVLNADDSLPSVYSDRQLEKLIANFFSLAIQSYQQIIDRNFAGLRSRLKMYSHLPASVVVSYRRPLQGESPLGWGPVSYALVEPATDGPSVEVYIDSADSVFPLTKPGTELVDFKGRVLKDGLSGTDLVELLEPSTAPPFGKRRRSMRCSSLAPVRAFAYGCLLNDFRSLSATDLLAALDSSNGASEAADLRVKS